MLVCKYRKRLLIKLGDSIKVIVEDVLNSNSCILDIMEVDKDHLHILFDTKPNINLSRLVNKIKSVSTYRIWRYNRDITQYLSSQFWIEKTFWSDGYFICSVGDASSETIRKYIESQG